MKILLKEPFILFEIENFLDHQTYDALNKSSKTYNLFHSLNKIKNLYIAKFDSDKIKSNKLNNLLIYDWYNFYSKATGEEYRYSRPNDIWLVPINVEAL